MKQIINSESVPAPVGPYSQAVRIGNLVVTSGQIPVDAATGRIESDVEKATELVLRNLDALLNAAGTGLDRAAKVTIFLTDMADFAKVNEVYGRFFRPPYPARSTVQVAALPKGVVVEIEVIAEV